MAVQYSSKHGIIGRSPAEVFMAFTDLRNFKQMVPADQKVDIEADFDTLTATVQGMSMGVKVKERVPYARISLEDYNAPFHFNLNFNFGDLGGGKTDFSMDVEAEIPAMIKMMVGNKIQKALDQIVESLEKASV